MIRSVKPIYGPDGDFYSGFDMFTIRMQDPAFYSVGIVWVMNKDEEVWLKELLKKYYGIEGFSHVVGVESETTGIEATMPVIRRCKLSEYLDDPKMLCIFREPKGLLAEDIKAKLDHTRSLIGNPYDLGTFPGFIVEAYTGFQNLFPPWRKVPMIGHLPGARHCSGLQTDGLQHTRYKIFEPMRSYHHSRVHVHRLFNSLMYKPLRFDKKRA